MQTIRNLFSGKSAAELRWLARLFLPYRARLLSLTVLRCCIIVLGILSALINKHLVDWAAAFFSVRGTVALAVVCSCGSLLGGALLSSLTVRFAQRCTLEIRVDLYSRLLQSIWPERTRLHSEDQLSRLMGDVERICDGVIGAATGLAATAVQFCLALALLFAFDRTVAAAALLSVPLIAACSLGFGIYLKRLQLQTQKADSECRVFLQEQLSHGDVIRAFAHELESEQALAALLEKKKRLVLKSTHCGIVMRLGVNGAFTAAYLFALVTGALKAASGSITYGTMTAFLSLVSQVQSPVLSLSGILSQLVGVCASAARVYEIADLAKEPQPIAVRGDAVGISAKGVCFSYQDGKPVLQNVSFEIAPGSITAVMGRSGAGKTTLIRLLLGFLTVDEGSLSFTLGASHLPCSPAVRSLISYVPQGNTLFSGTIAENLRLGCPEATQAQMLEALHAACADTFVQALPDGLQTCIGEKGHGLSEGQAQRIAIARAFLRPAPILLLDEATSALDEKTELEILTHLKAQCGQRTCVIISHRNSVSQFADQLIEL